MQHTIKIECPSCNGAGLYKGMAERGGAAVVCCICKGTGETTYTYNEFTGRKKLKNVNRVYRDSFGYGLDDKDMITENGEKIKFSQYGCTYDEWLNGIEPTHIEDLYCPYIAYNEGWGNEPLERCKEGCQLAGRISNCDFFHNKEACWALYDKKVKGKESR